MAISDMPNVPPQNVPVLIAQATQAQAGDTAKVRALGQCYPVTSNYYGGENTLSPLVAAKSYFLLYEPQMTFTGPATVTVLQQPKHGVLRLVTEADRGTLFSSGSRFDPSGQVYTYLPEQGYLGDDKASFLIERGGIKIRVVYFFKAVNGPLGNSGGDEYCEKTGIRWKISSTLDSNGSATISSVEYQSPVAGTTDTTLNTDILGSWLSLAQLDGKIADMSSLLDTLNAGTT